MAAKFHCQNDGRGLEMSFNHWLTELLQTCTRDLLCMMAEAGEPVLFTKVTVYSLLACVAQFAVGFAFAQKWGNKCSAVDRWVLVWLFYDAIVHFTLVSTIYKNAFVIPACNYLLASCLFHRAGGTLRLHVTCWKCSNFWQSIGRTMWVCCVTTLST